MAEKGYFMTLTNILLLHLLLFAVLSPPVKTQSSSTWSPADLKEILISNLLSAITYAGVFTPQQLDDISRITNIIFATTNRMAQTGKVSKSTLMTLNHAFAASLANTVPPIGSQSKTQPDSSRQNVNKKISCTVARGLTLAEMLLLHTISPNQLSQSSIENTLKALDKALETSIAELVKLDPDSNNSTSNENKDEFCKEVETTE